MYDLFLDRWIFIVHFQLVVSGLEEVVGCSRIIDHNTTARIHSPARHGLYIFNVAWNFDSPVDISASNMLSNPLAGTIKSVLDCIIISSFFTDFHGFSNKFWTVSALVAIGAVTLECVVRQWPLCDQSRTMVNISCSRYIGFQCGLHLEISACCLNISNVKGL